MTNLVTNAAPTGAGEETHVHVLVTSLVTNAVLRTGAGEETHVHVLVTNGELIPTLGKLLLFGASTTEFR